MKNLIATFLSQYVEERGSSFSPIFDDQGPVAAA